jgi:hypothetical protein
MPAQLELEEGVEAVLEEIERRERNSLAIAEVVGRNPARKLTKADLPRRTATEQPRVQRN